MGWVKLRQFKLRIKKKKKYSSARCVKNSKYMTKFKGKRKKEVKMK